MSWPGWIFLANPSWLCGVWREALHTSVHQLRSCWWKAPCDKLGGYMAGCCGWEFGGEEANPAGLGGLQFPLPCLDPAGLPEAKHIKPGFF